MSGVTTVTTRNPCDSWIKWFNSRDSVEVINKAHPENLFKSFDSSIDEKGCIKAMLSNPESIFLHKVSFGARKL